jgi:hypothetical protein
MKDEARGRTDKPDRPSKGILQTGSKPNTSKGRRISWGEIKVKEFGKHDEVHNRSGEEYNLSLNKIIKEEKERENDSMILDESMSIDKNNNVENSNVGNSKASTIMNNQNKLVNNFSVENFNQFSNNPFAYMEKSKEEKNNSDGSSNSSSIPNLFKPLSIIKTNSEEKGLESNNLFSFNNSKNNLVNNGTQITHINKSTQLENFSTSSTTINTNNQNNLLSSSSSSISKNKINTNLQNPFLSGFNNLPIIADNSVSEEFDLLNSGKSSKRLTIRGISDIFNSNIVSDASDNKKELQLDKIQQNMQVFPIENQKMQNQNHIIQGINSNVNINVNLNPTNFFSKTFESDNKSNNPGNLFSISNQNNDITCKPKQSRLTLNLNEELLKQETANNQAQQPLAPLVLKELPPSISDSETDKSNPNNKTNKRHTLNLQDAIKALYTNDNYDELNNSFEERLKEKEKRSSLNHANNNLSNISASPINIKTQKLYYETCLSSASRCIETNEAKNKKIITESNENKNEECNNMNNITILNFEKYEESNKSQERNSNSTSKEKNLTNSNSKKRITLLNVLPKDSDESKTNPVNFEQISQPLPNLSNSITFNVSNISYVPISPITKNLKLLKISNETNELDKRIRDLMHNINESTRKKQNSILDLEKKIGELNSKLTELNEEEVKLQNKKIQVKENIINLDKEINNILERKIMLAFPMKVLGIKILSSEFNILKIQILSRINLTFKFREFSAKMLKQGSANQRDNLNNIQLFLEKINFDIRKPNPDFSDRLFDDSNCHKIVRNIYEDIVNQIFPQLNSNLTLDIFIEKFKYIIKYSGSLIYLLDLLTTIHAVGMEFNFRYIKEKMSVIAQFSLLNKQGYKAIVNFEFEVLNSFFGIKFNESSIVNISASESNFNNRYRPKMMKMLADLKEYLDIYRDKMQNPFAIKDIILKLSENVLNLI